MCTGWRRAPWLLSHLGALCGHVQVRGCAFDHTAKRELMMAGLLNDALTPFNFTCGLIPAAVWTYNIPEAPFPKV